jgi:hypothetical protein
MAELHEQFLAALTGGRKSRASGATWQDPGDGRDNRLTTAFAFAWDGKSTTTGTISVTRDMLAKLRGDAGGERPMLGLRWYGTEDLEQVAEEWVAVTAADFGELLAEARQAADSTHTDDPSPVLFAPPSVAAPPPASEVLHGGYPPDLPPPPHELWPCKVIDTRHDPHSPTNEITKNGYDINDNGMVTEFTVTTVRVEPISEARNHLFVNELLVRRGQLYVDGRLEVQVGGPLF